VVFFSVNLDFSDREALLIGAGEVGRRKLATLLSAGAKVRVVEPEPQAWLLELATKGLVRLEPIFKESFLTDLPWVFIASRNCDQEKVIDLVKARGLWLNVADRPLDCNFMLPAVVDEDPLFLTVTTGGVAPALTARIAKDLRNRYRGYCHLAKVLGRIRPLVLASSLPEMERKKIFVALANSEVLLELLLTEGPLEKVRELLNQLVSPIELPTDFWLTFLADLDVN
jgi:precorrin-2 dehydrogenase/sirohydrochlorin ferrochelatase